MILNWKTTREDADLIAAIARRARHKLEDLGFKQPDVAVTLAMDITAAHLHDAPLNLVGLLNADDFDFGHDVYGIHRHIDRETGKLKDCFVPRYALRNSVPQLA